jgi:glycosyltransferase involved in cell wall biosynthesis
MTKTNLTELYTSLNKNVEKVFVVPKINYSLPETDYLYRLYAEFLENPKLKIQIESISVFAHPKIFLSFIFNRNIVLHYHWFEAQDIKSFAGIFWKLIWIILYKLIGGKIVWTLHNKFPHTENFNSFNKFIRKVMAKLADKLHAHCNTAVEIMMSVLNVKRDKFVIIEHPNFIAHKYPRNDAADKLEKKYNLKFEIDDQIYLMFGNIASYKGILEMVETFKKLSGKKKLLIVGGVKKGNAEYFKQIVNISSASQNIYIIDKIIPEKDVPIFFNLTDYVIFNYRQVLTSGGIFLSLNYDKKVIAPAIGCIPEIENQKIILFEESESGVNKLLELLQIQ